MSQNFSEDRSQNVDVARAEIRPPAGEETSSYTVTRADLADAVHRRIGLSRTEFSEFVESVLSEVFQAIVSGEDVKLSSFGSFHIRSKNERVGRNPKTGATAPISARRVVMFKASNVLRARINGHRPISKDR